MIKLAPPGGWVDSDDPTKDTSEMTLIGHSAVEGDFHEWVAGTEHDRLGMTHTLPVDICERSIAKALLECAMETTGAQLRDPGQITHPEVPSNVGFNEGSHTLCLPKSQATPRSRGCICDRSHAYALTFELQRRFGSGSTN